MGPDGHGLAWVAQGSLAVCQDPLVGCCARHCPAAAHIQDDQAGPAQMYAQRWEGLLLRATASPVDCVVSGSLQGRTAQAAEKELSMNCRVAGRKP